MSNGEAREAAPERPGLNALEQAVGRMLEVLADLRRRAATSDRRNAELEALLGSFEAGEESPALMKERLVALEKENGELRDRMSRGRETAERLLARIRFLENQK